MEDITICPFCLTVFLYTMGIGEECTECEVGILEEIDEYNRRIEESNGRENDIAITS
jgi:hypothetical protein